MSVPLARVGALTSSPLSECLWIKSGNLGHSESTARFGIEFLVGIAPWGEMRMNDDSSTPGVV
jgi:hypothetical protein